MKTRIFIVLILTVFAGVARGAEPTFAVKLNNSDPVQFCKEPVFVANDLTIEGTYAIKGMKISITEGYSAGEDTLVYSGSIGNIVGTWFNSQGYLLLIGDASTTVANYVDAIKTVSYRNNKSIPTNGTRKITFTLDDADYFFGTKHFYRFVDKPGIKWTEAEAVAKSDAMMYFGLRGYLATVTSMYENSFIKSKTRGVGWIGASDAAVEDEWRWVTGPEGLEDSGKGLLFWKGTGYQAKMNNPASVSGPVNGAYHNWNRWDQGFSSSLPTGTWEPNQSGDEDYAHITYFPNNANDSFKWNDLPNGGGDGDYVPAGYLIEFGDMPGDPTVELSATLELQVNTMSFYKTGLQPAICEGTSVMLNQADTTATTYVWTQAELFSSAPSIANPVVTPTLPSTTYTVTGTRGTCPADTATYIVPVNPKPISLLNPVEPVCKGKTITLNPGGVYQSYTWSTGATSPTIAVDATGEYSVTLVTDKTCSATFTTKVTVYEYPAIDLSKLQTIICDSDKITMVDITSNPQVGFELVPYAMNSGLQIDGLNVTAPGYGDYQLVYTAKDQYCPIADTIKLSFYKNPEGTLNILGEDAGHKCFGYNLDVTFHSTDDLSKANYTWKFGGKEIASEIGLYSLTVPLGVNLLARDLLLTVNNNGCSAPFEKKNILVTPKLKLDSTQKVGCEPFDVIFIADNTEDVDYFWDFGVNSTFLAGDKIMPYHYEKPGYYDVTVRVVTKAPNEGCINEVKIEKLVHVAPIPVVKFSLSPTDCLEPGENQISFTGTGLNGADQDTYTWNLEDFAASEKLNDPRGTPGPFKFDLKTKPQATIGLTVKSEFGCKSLPGSITLKRKPVFAIDPSRLAACVPFETQLSAIINNQEGEVDFTWDFNDGSPSGAGASVPHTYNEPGKNYNITLTGKSSLTQCKSEVTEILKTYPKPVAAFSMDHDVVYNDKPEVKFTDLSQGNPSKWLWDFGDGITSGLPDPSYKFISMGVQKVSLEVSNDELCTDTVSHTVLVAFDRLFPPNGFSPNAPNAIDREFKLYSDGISPEGYHFTVLSRWNDLVFEAKDEIKGWDGRMKNGSFAPAGAYVWILNFTDLIGRRHRQTGTVTLVY